MAEVIWNMFSKESIEIKDNDRKVKCILCENMVNYTVISDLKQHLIKEHSNYINVLELKTRRSRNKVLSIWNHFTPTECKYFAECNHCKKVLSYRTTTANLKKHLTRAHPEINWRSEVTETIKTESASKYDDSEDGQSDSEQNNEDAGEEQVQDPEIEDVWNYFEKIPPNKAQCILCKETFQRYVPFLTKHMKEKHRKVAWDHSSDSDEDQNVYTEVVYLEEEEQPPSVVTKSKHTKQAPVTKKRRLSSRYEFVNKPKEAGNTPKTDEIDEEIENFGRYVIGLLKKMPKDVSTQLQMDIISMIMKAKLKLETTTNETVSASVSNVTDGVIVTPSNVIVTTPSNVIHTTQNNESLPTLVIGVENES
ncbi:uncharacterized protein LOC123878317 isoform X3 [Maniola jurtina]|uniref:uncharacterized protein LOC123878317 isoform X3 n=1 Tax=Maniola jurtina TaxID=191418 RepID=UPI001E687B29|nr:uncharacterized protein LOC123878317 isoform X3 [Maniola jurtina]